MPLNVDVSGWSTTTTAAKQLGISPQTLKRYADRDEILLPGTHFAWGTHHNSPRMWNVPAIVEVLSQARPHRAVRPPQPQRTQPVLAVIPEQGGES